MGWLIWTFSASRRIPSAIAPFPIKIVRLNLCVSPAIGGTAFIVGSEVRIGPRSAIAPEQHRNEDNVDDLD